MKATIITECLPLLEHELEKLNKKALKLDCEPLKVTASDPYLKVSVDNRVDDVVDVEVHGDPIKLNGWRFIGRIEAVPNEDNLIFTVRGETAPDSYRKSSPYICQHCNQNRVRKATWIVQHDNGDLKQVGSSCMDDFLNAKSPEKAIAWWMSSMEQLLKYLHDLENRAPTAVTGFRQAYEPIMISAIDVVRHACQVVRERGKYEFSSETVRGTSSYVWSLVFAREPNQAEPNADDLELADKIAAYIIARRYDSDYFKNLAIMLIGERVQARNLNFAVSAVYTYMKEHNLLPGRPKTLNEYVGQVKERLRDLDLTVTVAHPIASAYHDTYDYIIVMKDIEGRTFMWKKTSAGNLLHKGDKVRVTGTVARHELYNGTMQTVLTRCNVDVTEAA